MKLGVKIGLVYLLVTGLFLEAAFIAHEALQAISMEARTALQTDESMLRLLAEARHEFELAWKESRLAAAAPRPAPDAARMRHNLARLLRTILDRARSEEKPQAEALLASWTRLGSAFEHLPARTRQASDYFNARIHPELEAFRDRLDELRALRFRAYEERVERIQIRADEARTQLIQLASLVAIAGGILFLVIRFRIISPLYRMIAATRLIAAGNLAHRVSMNGHDEFGDLANDFNLMASKLSDAERMKMEFLSMISHEMRTPLTAMGGYTALLRKGRHGSITEKQAASLDIIRQETERLYFLVDDLLEAARAEAGAFRIEVAACDLEISLDALMRTFSRQAEEKEIDLKYDLLALPKAILDGRRLAQALRNLVTNAMKFTPVGGSIRVQGRVEGNDILLEVSDTGAGIPASQIEHIFDRFYQTRPEADGRAGGVGLGLAIVREIVQAHGGRVDVVSELEKGTTFRLWIPLKAPPQESFEEELPSA